MTLLRIFSQYAAVHRTWLLCAVLLLRVPLAQAQPALYPIAGSGPVSNRFNIVFISEGYTTNDLARFPADAAKAFDDITAQAPFSEYRSYLNAYAIAVASAQSGSDHPAYGLSRNTYFNSTYDASDTLITIPADATGQGRVDALIQALLPACHLPVLLVNDVVSGGSDGFARTAIASTGYNLGAILIHEIGHVMAGLGDEYEAAYPGFPDTEEPNTTRQTSRSLVRWKAWIDPTTPLPTPETAPYAALVGLFEGAHYHSTGWYRPQLDCAMRSQGVAFCKVCSEALVLALLQRSRPIDATTPATPHVTWTALDTIPFRLQLQQPASHGLTVDWRVDNRMVASGPVTELLVSPQALGDGAHTVQAAVRDPTALVRTDPAGWLSQTSQWQLQITLKPVLQISHAPVDGRLQILINGNTSATAVVEGSTNLLNWMPLRTNTLAAGPFWFTNDTGWTNGWFRAFSRP